MKAAIIGCGLMGRQRARSVAQCGHQLVAVYDPSRERAAALGGEYGASIVDSPAALLDTPGLDVVIIAVPHWITKDMAIAALSSGKHTFCEKPLGRTLAEADAILAAQERAGVLLTPGFNYRFYPGFRSTRKLVQQGRIGRPTHLRFVLGHGGRPGYESEWKTSRDLCGGGALLDPGIHVIDLTRYLLGEVRKGDATLFRSFWNIDVEDNVFATLVTEDGQPVQIHISITEWKSRCVLDVFGTDGSVRVTGRSGFYGPQQLILKKRWDWLAGENETVIQYSEEDTSFTQELQSFFQRIRGQDVPELATGEDGRRALEIVEQLYSGADIVESASHSAGATPLVAS